MKKIFFIASIVCCVFQNCDAQNWLWGKYSTGSSAQEGFSIAVDSKGNSYITGETRDSVMTFDSITVNLPSVNSSQPGIFLAMYDKLGNIIWAIGAIGNGEGNSVSVDKFDNVYLSGFYWYDKVIFNSDTLFNPYWASNIMAFFLVKFDSSGNIIWLKQGIGNNSRTAITTDNSGSIYVSGLFNTDTLKIGSYNLLNTSASGNDDQLFLAKFDSTGNIMWANSYVGIFLGGSYWYPLATDKFANIYISGTFISQINLGTINLITNGTFSGNFISKIDTNGLTIWAKQIYSGSTNSINLIFDIVIDSSENSYVTGCFNGPYIIIEQDTFYNPLAASVDFFIIKYDNMGNKIWAKTGTGIGFSQGYSLCIDSKNNVFVSGGLLADGNSFSIDNTIYQFPVGPNDPMFLIKISPNGNIICASSLLSGGDDVNDIALDPEDNLYLGGDFYGINPFYVGPDTLILTGIENIFVAKFNCDKEDGINELKNSVFTLYPNPFSTQFTLQLKCISNISIYNLIGEKLIALKNASGTVTLGKELSSGMYILKIKNENGEISKSKIVKAE